ncbi:MAG: hypothetical protein JXX28_05445 [Deltaproteobacteria bacterium]|nr:hypothetical protein [Deltaproteobacteria bacterium]
MYDFHQVLYRETIPEAYRHHLVHELKQVGKVRTYAEVTQGGTLTAAFADWAAAAGAVDAARFYFIDADGQIGWFGAVRALGSPPYRAQEVQALQAWVPALLATYRRLRSLRLDRLIGLSAGQSLRGALAPDGEPIGWERPIVDQRAAVPLGALLREAVTEAQRGAPSPYARDGAALFLTPLGPREAPDGWLARLTPAHGITLRPADRLSDRQREIALLVAAGLTLAETGRELGISLNTVKTHLRSVYKLLGVSNRVELAAAMEPQ